MGILSFQREKNEPTLLFKFNILISILLIQYLYLIKQNE